MPSYKLTYFAGKGRAESIRIALYVAGISFIDERLNYGQFKEMKETLPFGQLPVLTIDDKTVLPMEVAILKYVGRKTGLYPNDPEEAAQADVILCLADDISAKFAIFYSSDFADSFAAKRKVIEEAFPKLLGYLDKRLAANGTTYSVGNNLTVADIRFYALLSMFTSTIPGLPRDFISRYPHVTKLYQAVDSHEKVAGWNKKQAA